MRRQLFPCAAGAAAVMLAGVGCGSQNADLERRLDRLQAELTRLQNSHDELDDRMATAEVAAATADSKRSGLIRERQSRPPLKVVKVSPQAAPVAGAMSTEAEPAPARRVKIVGSGERIETVPVEADGSRAEEPEARHNDP